MDGFTMSIAGRVAGNVAFSVKALGRQLRDATLGTPEEQAIARAVTAGLAAIAERALCDNGRKNEDLLRSCRPFRMSSQRRSTGPVDLRGAPGNGAPPAIRGYRGS
jgi:hypothetical protein